MKDLCDLTLVNKKELDKWMTERMKHNYSFIYQKSKIGGYDLPINISCKCINTGEIFNFIWREDNIAMLDTDGCSFGELD